MAGIGIITAAAIHCLSQNIYFEARSEPVIGQMAVAQVTINRVESDLYPDDICAVVHQRNQFSWYWDGKSDTPRNIEAWEDAQMIAMYAIGNPNMVEDEFPELKNSLYYHSNYVTPSWAKRFTNTATIGSHLFYER